MSNNCTVEKYVILYKIDINGRNQKLLNFEELKKIRDLRYSLRSAEDYYNSTSFFKELGLNMPAFYDEINPETPYILFTMNEDESKYVLKNHTICLEFDKYEDLYEVLEKDFKDYLIEVVTRKNSHPDIDPAISRKIPMNAYAGIHSVTKELMVIEESSNTYRLDYSSYLSFICSYVNYLESKNSEDENTWLYAKGIANNHPANAYLFDHDYESRKSSKCRNREIQEPDYKVLRSNIARGRRDYSLSAFKEDLSYDRNLDKWCIKSHFPPEDKRIFSSKDLSYDNKIAMETMLEAHVSLADTPEEAYIEYVSWLIDNYNYDGSKREKGN